MVVTPKQQRSTNLNQYTQYNNQINRGYGNTQQTIDPNAGGIMGYQGGGAGIYNPSAIQQQPYVNPQQPQGDIGQFSPGGFGYQGNQPAPPQAGRIGGGYQQQPPQQFQQQPYQGSLNQQPYPNQPPQPQLGNIGQLQRNILNRPGGANQTGYIQGVNGPVKRPGGDYGQVMGPNGQMVPGGPGSPGYQGPSGGQQAGPPQGVGYGNVFGGQGPGGTSGPQVAINLPQPNPGQSPGSPGGSTNVGNLYQNALNRANNANEGRYNEILQGYGNLGNAAMNQAQLTASQQYRNISGRSMSDLTKRGLGNSSLRGNAAFDAYERSQGTVLNTLMQSAGNQLGFMERRNDVGPDIGQMLQVAQQQGLGGGGGGSDPNRNRMPNYIRSQQKAPQQAPVNPNGNPYADSRAPLRGSTQAAQKQTGGMPINQQRSPVQGGYGGSGLPPAYQGGGYGGGQRQRSAAEIYALNQALTPQYQSFESIYGNMPNAVNMMGSFLQTGGPGSQGNRRGGNYGNNNQFNMGDPFGNNRRDNRAGIAAGRDRRTAAAQGRRDAASVRRGNNRNATLARQDAVAQQRYNDSFASGRQGVVDAAGFAGRLGVGLGQGAANLAGDIYGNFTDSYFGNQVGPAYGPSINSYVADPVEGPGVGRGRRRGYSQEELDLMNRQTFGL